MKATLTSDRRPTSRTNKKLIVERNGQKILPAGTVIENKDAFKLCMMGIAKPADNECWDALASRGWGKDEFDAKFEVAAAQQKAWEKGIIQARVEGAPIAPTPVEAPADES